MGNLDQNAGAIAGLRIAAAGAAMRQVQQDLNSLFDDVVTLLTANAGDKPDAAGVMLMRRIVEALSGGQAVCRVETASSWTPSRDRFPFESAVCGRALLGGGYGTLLSRH